MEAPRRTALSIPGLREVLDGPVLGPDDPGYDEARRVHYPHLDRRPAAIARAAHARDVARVVLAARETGLDLAVRSGGHSLAGHGTAEGGIVLDLRGLDDLVIDPEARTAWAGPGVTAGAYTRAAGAHGLATGFGDAGTVGLGGITTGGGIGFLVRKHGLTIDSLLAAEVVTADGAILQVDETHHADLFWAIRGGGGNVGVVTRLHLRLHEVGTVLGGMLLLPATPSTVAGFVAAADAAPEELSAIAGVMVAPPMPFVPAAHHGRPIIMALIVHAGPVEDGERALAPFRALAEPIADLVEPIPYPRMFEGPEPPVPAGMEVRTLFLDAVDVDLAGTMLARLEAATADMAVVQLRVLGGAVAKVPADATAFAHRHRRIMANVAAAFSDPAEAPQHAAWVEGLAAALRQGEPGAYVGFLGDEGPDRVREAYPGATWERLAAVKGRYDPTNVFRLNQNVPPSASAQT